MYNSDAARLAPGAAPAKVRPGTVHKQPTVEAVVWRLRNGAVKAAGEGEERLHGAEPVAPANPTRPPVPRDRAARRRRLKVENFWRGRRNAARRLPATTKPPPRTPGERHLAASLSWSTNER